MSNWKAQVDQTNSPQFFFGRIAPLKTCKISEIKSGSVCFAVKYFPKNVFRFASVYFTVKWWSNGK